MNSNLCIGIASTNDSLEVAAQEPGKVAVVTKFPAMGRGIEGIRDFPSGYGNPLRMAEVGASYVGTNAKGSCGSAEFYCFSNSTNGAGVLGTKSPKDAGRGIAILSVVKTL